MRTVLLGARPPAVEDWLRLRRERGQDRFDEVWEGEVHVAPGPSHRHGLVDHRLARLLGPLADRAGLVGSGPCNLGTPDDFRVPDQAYFRTPPHGIWSPSAAIVVEIVSPDDETWQKLAFYHRTGVEELLIADPDRTVLVLLVAGPDGFRARDHSPLLGVSVEEVAAGIDWPE